MLVTNVVIFRSFVTLSTGEITETTENDHGNKIWVTEQIVYVDVIKVRVEYSKNHI